MYLWIDNRSHYALELLLIIDIWFFYTTLSGEMSLYGTSLLTCMKMICFQKEDAQNALISNNMNLESAICKPFFSFYA